MKKLLSVMLCLLFLAGCASNSQTQENASSSNSNSNSANTAELISPESESELDLELELEPELEPEPITVQILGAGDNLIHTGIYRQGAKRANYEGYDFTYTYENVADLIAAADFASLNQECVMANQDPSSYPRFNAPQEIGDAVVDIGFDLLNLSNNHMFDKGESGLIETMDFLATKEDLIVTGAYYDEADYLDIPTADVEGIVFAFVSATQHTNGLSIPESSPLVTPLIPDDGTPASENESVLELIAQVERAAEISDVVVANIHWGNEYTYTPTSFQYEVAQLLVEAGVDILYGHHPHVLQPIEYLTRTDGTQAVVCYSLGNFISCQDHGARMIGGLMDVTVTKNPDGSITLDDVELIPVITHFGWTFSNVTVYLYDQYSDELASAHGVREYTSSFSMDYIYNVVTDVIDEEFLPEDFHEIYGPAA